MLSDVFVDNEIDYPGIARQLAGYDRAAVKKAPVCRSNLQTPIPPIWAAFDSTWLADTIDINLRARRASRLRHMRDQVLFAYLRFRLREAWSRIEQKLEARDSRRAG
ncbi:hypothetical protein UIB01_10065 [Stutzerimonas decontaminans]|uniref:DUF7079 domain-containing protein n=1 Tax=Stutzerimonas stutzeri TaxID=316 RepID=A0A023WS22_STUST|nr:hypothetical protein UIB01_10065 [Stutzerimonas decontaminans]